MTMTSESDPQRKSEKVFMVVKVRPLVSQPYTYQIIHGFMFPEPAERRQSCQDDPRRMVSSNLRDHLPLLLHLRCQLHEGIAVPAKKCHLFIVM